MAANFKRDLSTGKAGETLVHQMWPELERLDGLQYDFITPDGEGLEVKSESRSMQDTPNMFIETISNSTKGSPGGVYQAYMRGATLFGVLYVPDKTLLVFKTVDLIKLIESKKFSKREVLNRNYRTVGLLVPREAAKHLLIKELKSD